MIHNTITKNDSFRTWRESLNEIAYDTNSLTSSPVLRNMIGFENLWGFSEKTEKVFDAPWASTGTIDGFAVSGDSKYLYRFDEILGVSTFLQYEMTIPGDASTCVYLEETTVIDNLGISGIAAEVMRFRKDGLKVWLLGGQDIYALDLDDPWMISTASYSGETYTFSESINNYGFGFNSDGTKLYLNGYTNDTIYQYSLDAWNISTLSYDSVFFDYSGISTLVLDMIFSDDEETIYILDATTGPRNISKWKMSTRADITSIVFDRVLFAPNIVDNPGPQSLRRFFLSRYQDVIYFFDSSSTNRNYVSFINQMDEQKTHIVPDSATVVLDLFQPLQKITLTQDLTTFSTSSDNRQDGQKSTFFVEASALSRDVTLNASWKSYGLASPITIPTGKTLRLDFNSKGPNETDVSVLATLEN